VFLRDPTRNIVVAGTYRGDSARRRAAMRVGRRWLVSTFRSSKGGSSVAVSRDRPYTQFNFLVDIGTGDSAGVDGGFETVTGLESWVDVIEYRNGNSKENSPIKLTGLNRVSDVTLKRGLIGSISLYQWFDDIRNGNQNALRTVTISLQNEDRTEIAMTWKLQRARITKYSAPDLNAQGNDVAIEEIVISHERLEIE
jgi:phage tail-like protein